MIESTCHHRRGIVNRVLIFRLSKELSKWVKINKEKRAKAEKAQKVSPYNATNGVAVRRVPGICSIPIEGRTYR